MHFFYALVGLLFHVKLLVLLAIGPGSEVFPTQAALIGPLAGMGFQG